MIGVTSFNYAHLPGATHCSEVNSIFDINMFVGPYVRTAKDKKVTKTICTLLTNFAKSGNPNGKSEDLESFQWLPISKEFPDRHLIIKANPEMKESLDHKRFLRQAAHFDTVHQMMTLIGEEEYTEFSIGVKDLR